MRLESTPCCGVSFIEGINDTPDHVIYQVCEQKWSDWDDDRGQAFLIFTDTTSSMKNSRLGSASYRGEKLAKFIIKHKLGTVISPNQRKNPNSGNMIKAWIWTPNEKNLRKWFKNN